MTEEFEVLSEIEHILRRPAMYVGNASEENTTGYFNGEYKTLKVVPALLKIINEVIDNSVDEYVRTSGKFANKIEVDFISSDITGDSVSVRDNGRGIPVEKLAGGEYRPVLAWTQARAGSNFGDDADRVTIGMNGVGSVCTNVFSTEFRGITSDGKNKLSLVSTKNASTKDVKVSKSSAKFTEVVFRPDLERLGGLDRITEDHVEVIRERLVNLAASYPGLQFFLNEERIKFTTPANFVSRFGDSHITLSDDNGVIAILPSGKDEEFRLHSYVNGLFIKNGGSHVDYVLGGLCDELRPIIKRKHKIEILPNQIKQHLLLVTILRGVKNLKFDSQTKERLTNSKAELDLYLGNIDYKKLAKKVLETPDIIDPMIQSIIAKKEAADRLALARQQKKLKKVRIAKHVEAQGNDPEKKILYISEGDSAAGRLASLRNSKTVQTVGGYPLRGKVMNVHGMKPTDIVKNKEISELMAVLGLQLGKKADSLNYGKIAIMTDMDTDGDAITCLLVNFFRNWPELFDEGRICRALSPLVIAQKGKNTKKFFTYDDFSKAKLDNSWDVSYLKGLGTLNKETYRDMINNPVLVHIELDESGSLDMAFGEDSDVRKKWLLGED